MPRPQNSLLNKYFEYNNENTMFCKSENCAGKILNKHPGNLERHLRAVHPELFSKYKIEKGAKTNNGIIIKVKTSKELKKQNIELAIVELFTKNERPLDMIQDRAFQFLIQPIFDSLNITLNSQNVNDKIVAFANNIKVSIINDLRGKLISLKIDKASRKDLSVLGINVQFVRNSQVIIKTLAIKELRSSLNGKHLKSIILDVLKEYEININQILTITTDNRGNMLKAVRYLNKDLQNALKDDNGECDLANSYLNSNKSDFVAFTITGVLCGAHLLQICVNDVIKNISIKEKCDKCRAVAKKLRSPSIMKIFKHCRYKKPIVDTATHWGSTYNMLERLIELREVIESFGIENSELFIPTSIWDFAEEFINLFKSLYDATMRMHNEQLVFSELFILIMNIQFEIQNMPSTVMNTLLKEAIEKTKSKLLSSELINVAVFFDPRIKVCLNSEQTFKAKQYIRSLYKRIISLNESNNTVTELHCIKTEMEVSTATTCSPTNPQSFLEFLEALDQTPMQNEGTASVLESSIVWYEYQQRLPLNANVLEFWRRQHDVLGLIANIVLGIPSTEVSNESVLSALKYIADHQNILTKFNFEKIWLVRLNGDFVYEKD